MKCSGWIYTICKQCGKEIKISKAHFNAGQGKFCSRHCLGVWRAKNDPTIKRILSSEAAKERNQDPARKAKAVNAMHEANRRKPKKTKLPKPKKDLSQCMRAQWGNPEIRTSRVDGIKRASNRPEIKAKRSEALKQFWSDPENKKARIENIKKVMARPEYKKKVSGQNSATWRGGLSFRNYCFKFNRAFKEKIRNKFNRECFMCGELENGRSHCVHHIDYNRNSICNGKEWAFVPLCLNHHNKTNYNRWYWFNLLIHYWARDYMNFDSAGWWPDDPRH